MTILSDIKPALGVNPENLGFDAEILMYLNTIAGTAAENGVSQFQGLVITETTEWPEITNPVIRAYIPTYFALKIRSLFDPIPSETISKVIENATIEYEGRITHEVEVDENAQV